MSFPLLVPLTECTTGPPRTGRVSARSVNGERRPPHRRGHAYLLPSAMLASCSEQHSPYHRVTKATPGECLARC